MDHAASHIEDLHIPTTIGTQLGLTDALPKLERGTTKKYEGYRDPKTNRWHKVVEGYTKRHVKKGKSNEQN